MVTARIRCGLPGTEVWPGMAQRSNAKPKEANYLGSPLSAVSYVLVSSLLKLWFPYSKWGWWLTLEGCMRSK